MPAEVTAAAAAGAGCTLVSREGDEMQWECPTGWAAARFLYDLAQGDADDPLVRRVASSILRRARSSRSAAAAAQDFVQGSIRFAREEGERFQAPKETIKTGVGDCDCHARLLAGILGAMGVPWRLAFLHRGRGPLHVVVQALLDGEWTWLETTVRRRGATYGTTLLGEHPIRAAQRAGIMRTDIGQGMQEVTMGGPIGVEGGTVYRMRVGVLASYDSLPDRPELCLYRALSELGFRDVTVWLETRNLPVDFPEHAREPMPEVEWTAWAEGMWGEPESRMIDLPAVCRDGELPIVLDDVTASHSVRWQAHDEAPAATIGDFPGVLPTAKKTDAEILSRGRETLRQALVQSGIAAPREEALFWLLGIAWGESRLGSTPDWGDSNNWGAVTFVDRSPMREWGFLAHADHDAQGRAVTYKFQKYPSQLEGAKGFLRVILRGNVPNALRTGTPTDVARAMFENRYYTGVSGSADDRIRAYASLITNSAAYVKKKLSPMGPVVQLAPWLALAGAIWYATRA